LGLRIRQAFATDVFEYTSKRHDNGIGGNHCVAVPVRFLADHHQIGWPAVKMGPAANNVDFQGKVRRAASEPVRFSQLPFDFE
jgi:hypothetical protein